MELGHQVWRCGRNLERAAVAVLVVLALHGSELLLHGALGSATPSATLALVTTAAVCGLVCLLLALVRFTQSSRERRARTALLAAIVLWTAAYLHGGLSYALVDVGMRLRVRSVVEVSTLQEWAVSTLAKPSNQLDLLGGVGGIGGPAPLDIEGGVWLDDLSVPPFVRAISLPQGDLPTTGLVYPQDAGPQPPLFVFIAMPHDAPRQGLPDAWGLAVGAPSLAQDAVQAALGPSYVVRTWQAGIYGWQRRSDAG